MSWYYNYKPRIQTDEGIKARSKRGAFVKNWWAGHWIQAMERVMERGRLQRGRTYARKGQVLSLKEETGRISAKVQGSQKRPYAITISIQALGEAEWQRVLNSLAERPIFVAQLLAGEMPQDIEDAFTAVKLSLFPGRRELKQHCSCPDSAAVCKHLAAVHYILAERFDEDPFLLFRLRGKSQDEILAALSPGAALDDEERPEYAPPPPLAESLATFWQIGPELEQFRARVARPETPYPVLERLGDPDFLPGARRWLARAYDTISETAVQVAFSNEGEDETNS